ncbi:winged helix-turn-helix domain-containing protein [Plantactinospora sp. S1510]|uniref:Winged helix-turn-helix domain-containing protein n=1 Tax=Plantactinospora alkalitolerans TaxID=2789879 RepID=A0ABS0H435_9ACTN|nr:BTAD domain-containing putative transcriptional regulator [Plantactinospora alkalitolerans]MBF9133219.1 winged helix-turn-helix domain-containing protein [Plantactinospora alkalitolerans]
MTDGGRLPRTSFATLLRQYRQTAGLTQLELAHRSGLSITAVRDLEQRRTLRPTRRSVSRLTAALELGPRPAAILRGSATAGTDRTAAAGVAAPVGRPMVSILGPLRVQQGAVTVDLTSSRQRVLLARLAVSAGTTVSRRDLLEVLWTGEQPESAVNLLHTYVARLRRVLDPGRSGRTAASVLTHASGGYRLELDEDQLDLLRFQRLVREATEADGRTPAQAVARLADALTLWRGDPLGDVEMLSGHPVVASLTTWLTATALRYADLLDQCGDYAPVVDALRPIAGRCPLDEQVHARLILALGATGRQDEAYAEYDGIVRRLADQLGADPGTELREYHQRLLRQQWTGARRATAWSDTRPAVPVPIQAPAPVPDFTGRAEELRRVREVLVPSVDWVARPSAPVCVIAGLAGTGKTALALVAAEQLGPAFPDGQLYADLRGRSDQPAAAGEVLVRFLHGLGVSEDRVRGDDESAAALLRSVLADRRVLIVLDDARDAAQVRPLLPGRGGSRVLVTARNRLVALEGARRIDVTTLDTREALDLLAAIVPPARTGGDRIAALEVVSACGHLPLALRIAGVRLTTRARSTVADLSRRLADPRRRLDELRVGDLDLRSAFRSSVDQLPAPAARAFRLLALAPEPLLGLAAAAALLDRPTTVVDEELQQLADLSLLVGVGPGQFRLHELLRLYGRELAQRDEPARDRAAALARLAAWRAARILRDGDRRREGGTASAAMADHRG